ncbi:hypothetical protein [Herbaspirillum huttiense]|jgi:hypothetical protein|uniref:hypothetical protein n=1 Tax=Herbaspirillum huttiense TaxID=863372 RepID=UPI0003467353|nr:hypothetical protein [Herbaspirillum sp. B39]
MSQDNGNWLSAEQAVMPDGSERQNLPLINRKLPHLSPQQAADSTTATDAGEASPAPAGPAAAD